ncbi:hypothetical protein [Gordonia rhizosphera]|uniref:Two-component histidine kinase n=1 Tax=Gordonia rhizosphera NBRC 16068 TaxID=1108045 RepID=K6WFS5_9ACTN|nr:hypothetical protein [Gordonia rhizosphera]GAB91027.1 hypothetical protein GORHZ_121_00200 [Gordonia rhizosphera NBRC 16068]
MIDGERTTGPQREDVRDLLGMRQPGAWFVLGAFLLATWVAIAYTFSGVSSIWPVIIAGLVISASAVAIMQVPGDPIPPWTTVALAASGPVACALAVSVSPAEWATSVLLVWAHGGAVAVYCFMCVRGRLAAPWVGLIGEAVVFAIWAQTIGQSSVGIVVAVVAIDAAPLTMATLFSFTLRPTAKAVFALRAQTITQVGRLSAESAAAEERASQVRTLDHLARPMLERIASGEELSAEERRECALLEAHLRDRLRAPLMSTLDLDEPAYRARTQGVEVVFIDDSRPDVTVADTEAQIDPRVASAVSGLATTVLDEADEGQIYVRVSPPDRPIAASVLHRRADGSSIRSEIDQSGAVRSFS